MSVTRRDAHPTAQYVRLVQARHIGRDVGYYHPGNVDKDSRVGCGLLRIGYPTAATERICQVASLGGIAKEIDVDHLR
jgi:hypothetical protein